LMAEVGFEEFLVGLIHSILGNLLSFSPLARFIWSALASSFIVLS
jgi:hypothetical protein